MKIRGIGCSMPERVVTNAEILQELMVLSDPFLYDGQKEKVKSTVNALFRISGSRNRRRRNNGDRAYDYAHRAVQQALDRAQMKPAEIDLLIYVGVGRGWVEPGMATFFLHKFGMSNATGFDILDACLSWMRALHIGYHFIQNGVYKNIMVLNAEFNYEYHGPIKNPDEVAYRFAQLTIGESATATILSAGEPSIAPHFEFKTDPSQHDLCKIPLPNIASYSDTEKCPQLDPLVFFAYSAELFNAANEMIPALYLSSPEMQGRHCDIAFAHSASKSIIDNLARQLNFGDKVVNLFPEFGNTVSASIPTAICWALENNRLRRGMEMMLFMGSAGFSVGICHMVY
jgi:3-oxoacyl-[acyl-carrier-protein] synthase III